LRAGGPVFPVIGYVVYGIESDGRDSFSNRVGIVAVRNQVVDAFSKRVMGFPVKNIDLMPGPQQIVDQKRTDELGPSDDKNSLRLGFFGSRRAAVPDRIV
jgi:hypothetical protein